MYRTVISRIDSEAAHGLSFKALRALDRIPLARRAVARVCATGGSEPFEFLGLQFPNRLGLAAGFDKNGSGVRAMSLLGFGHIEVGTVTAHAQPGNERPRLFRLMRSDGLLNRMGFNNVGARQVAINLRRARTSIAQLPRHQRPVIGVNIGKTKIVPLEGAVADYEAAAKILAPLADYLVINVSSPNTPGLRDLQATESLRPIILAVKAIANAVKAPASSLGRVPLLVKIAPDLADDDVRAVADLAIETGIDGLIATNTLLDRSGLSGADRTLADAQAGGISGRPVAERSREVLALLREHAGDSIVVVSAGGICNAKDARDRLAAGASLVQAYSALVFGGPLWASRVVRGMSDGQPRLLTQR